MSIIKTLLEDANEREPIDRKEKIEKIFKDCPFCDSSTTKEVLEPPSSLQYSRIYCAECNEFLRVGRNPKITEACEVRDRQILFILENFELSHNEEVFLNDRLYQRFATPKQRDWMDRIANKTLEHPFDWSAYEKRPSG